MRSVENRLARTYTRRSFVADIYTLYGESSYDLAREWLDSSQAEVIRAIEIILALNMAGGELLERFRSCMLAERYLRRRQYRNSIKEEIAA